VILDNLSNSNAGVLDKVITISGKKIEEDIVFVECDLRDKQKMQKIFTDHAPIVSVIHFAGLKAVGESCSKPLEYYDNNVGGSFTLFQVMQEFNCKDIVFSSSATVYGDNRQATEDDPIGATNPYGQTKVHIE
jgi:UDP-glucose 4-epimerase